MNVVAGLHDEWDLLPDGAAYPSAGAGVWPVLTADGRPAMLKVGGSSEQEHLALQAWRGGAAVRLLRADPRRRALLLERAEPGDRLDRRPGVEVGAVVGGLYGELHLPALPQLPRLSARCAEWVTLLAQLVDQGRVPRRLAVEAHAYARGFAIDPQTDGRLLHTALDGSHVLAARRRPWLVVAPKPLSGDPCFEPAPVLRAQWAEVMAAPRARDEIVDRFYAVTGAAVLDESRTRAWVIVRELVALAIALAGPDPGSADVGGTVTLVKALPT